MQRQLAKAGYTGGHTAAAAHADGRAALLDVTAWLVINSMKAERLQFDQLCSQNLSNIWREHAFEQLLDGHRRFTVGPGAASGYTLDMLGEAFVSNRDGHVSRAKIEDKVLALFFRSSLVGSQSRHDNTEAATALREVYDRYQGGGGVAFEVIQIETCTSPEAFATSFREAPWLAIPFTHVQRRAALRRLFEVAESEVAVVLLSSQGMTITREGRELLLLAHASQQALDKKGKAQKSIDQEQESLGKERARLAEQLHRLAPLREQVGATVKTAESFSAAERGELQDFLAEPAVGKEAQAALDAASQKLLSAKRTIRALPIEELDRVRTIECPPPSLQAAVEAVATLFGLKPDFALAQSRLMRSSEGLRRRVLGFEPEQMPVAAPMRLRHFAQAREPGVPEGAADPVVDALCEWVGAIVGFEQATTEAKLSVQEVNCSAAMAIACECVCDVYGLTNVDDDLKGTLQLAAAFPRGGESSAGTTAAEASAESMVAPTAVGDGELAQEAEQQIEAMQQKAQRLRQFVGLLEMEVDGSRLKLKQMQEQVRQAQMGLNDRANWAAILRTDGDEPDEMLRAALSLLLGLVYPDSLTKALEGGADVSELCASLINVTSRVDFETFFRATKGIEVEVSEGRFSTQDRDMSTVQALSMQLDGRFHAHRFKSGGNLPITLCQWGVQLCKYQQEAAELTAKKAQAESMRAELAAVQKAVEEAGSEHARGGVSATQLKAVLEEVHKRGIHDCDAEAVRWALERATGRESLAVSLLLAQPEARRVLQALREPTTHLLTTEAELSSISQSAVRKVRVALRREEVGELVEACAQDGAEGGDDERVASSRAETMLIRWLVGVSDYVEALARTQPQQQKVMLLERKLEEKERSLKTSLHEQRRASAKAAARLELPASLFPAREPWKCFPWEAHFLPRSETEEALRTALNLRDLRQLDAELERAKAMGLTRRNSRVFFESVELAGMLTAQQAMAAAASQGAIVGAATDEIEIEPRSPLRGRAMSAANVPPALTREKTEDATERLGRALDVFVEPVSTAVPACLPRPRAFGDILKERADDFAAFVQPADKARCDAILAAVSGAHGVDDIETEQCREQEQEKAQEQEQEQTIEMERYVDVAYQRDNEEPKRWAFCTLAERAEGGVGGRAAPTPFAEGTFYPAAEFRLHGRAPLPFAPCLAISRNHFNPAWAGERRLKNAVCVLEYVPDVGALQRRSPDEAALTSEQEQRLDDALTLLDLKGERSYGRYELTQLLRAAEHEEPGVELIDRLLGSKAALSYDEVRKVLTSGMLRRGDVGRHFVVLSLAEAETIRCVLHMRQGQPLIPRSNVALALRCTAAHDAVIDATLNFPTATTYQQRIAHQSLRFFDSAMHYQPRDLNGLLRNLPAPPAMRRLFFSSVVACRRRLAKRWELTPIAKLFALEDEWMMLKLEAVRVRIFEAIHARGLLLHDAFLLFDGDDDGLLSLAEVSGALEWLGLVIQPADVIAFVRSLSREPHLSYGCFMELLSSVEDGKGEEPSTSSVQPAGHKLRRAPTAACAKLSTLWEEGVREERRVDARLEQEMSEQAERARAFVESQLLEADFSWMRETRSSNARNPRTTRTSCFYDFTRGKLGAQDGAPLWMEGRGNWFFVRQGSARVPCLKASNAFLVIRVPFRKSGGGTYCNTWTLSAMIKFTHAGARSLLSTGGWDQFTRMEEGDDTAQVTIDRAGRLGAHGTFSAEGGAEVPCVEAGQWAAISVSVDAIEGVVRTYVNGEEAATIRSPKVCKDGQDALKGRLALFFDKHDHSDTFYYLRQATVHNRALEATQVRAEHRMLHELLMEDAIEAVPSALRQVVRTKFDGEPPASTDALRECVRELKTGAVAKAEELWASLLLGPTDAALDAMHVAMAPHDMALAARWRASTTAVEETEEPKGDTLLHLAAYVGCRPLTQSLLAAGASASLPGSASGCTALHAAAANGHLTICESLLQAGASPATLSIATKRSPLHFACLKGHTDVARTLITKGGADPYATSGGNESCMALLRRLGTVESLALIAELDSLCGQVRAETTGEGREKDAVAADAGEASMVDEDGSASEDDEGGQSWGGNEDGYLEEESDEE